MLAWCQEFGSKLAPYICDTSKYLYEAEKAGKNIMFEAQLGALRDIDFGIFPYTSSSSSNAGYACVGAGIPGSHVDRTVGIVKAYSTCVGEISGVRKYEDLPQAARDYVEYIEKAIGVRISYVSVGAGRDEIIYR